MERSCRNCGAELKINAKFCPKCGCEIIESSLIKRIKNGDTQAWEELYKKTYPRAYAVAVQTMKNREDALDVLQEAYVSVFKNIDSLQDESKLNAWVSKIVGNRCIDYLRKYRGKNEPTLFGEMISDDSDVEFEDILENDNQEFIPEESVDYDETKKIMQGILDQLPDEQRLCVLMYYYDELSVKEIAETLGCSTGTVKSRLNYARKYIKKEVEKQEKKGTKLYSIAPISFLIWMLHSQENTVQAKAAEPSVWKAVQTKAGMLEHEAGKKVGKAVVGKAAKTGAKGITSKIAAGAVAVSLAGTGVGIGYMKTHSKPTGAVEFNHHYYKVFSGEYTWSEAEKQCEEQGGHLVTITSEGEQNFINSLIDSDSCVWIGGKRNTKNLWVWVTGEEWKYENWASGEPNNSSNMISNENRVVIWNNSGQWNDLNDKNIEEQNGFVCEWA